MLRRFHRLRRTEEGQVLVLACVALLILAIGVLATVNIANAAYQKIKLQNEADAAAYSVAALEARALNVIAYTNRAMVVHYTALMNTLGFITYAIFWVNALKLMEQLFSLIPYVGTVIAAIIRVVRIFLQIFFYLLEIASYAIFFGILGANATMYGIQKAIADNLSRDIGGGPGVWITDPKAQVVNRDEGTLNRDSFRSAIWGTSLWDSLISYGLNQADQTAQLARATMVELANSGRHPWTAHGTSRVIPFPRRLDGRIFGIIRIGKIARTEMGIKQPGNFFSDPWGYFGASFDSSEIYSDDRFRVEVNLWIIKITFNYGFTGWANILGGGHSTICSGGISGGGFIARLVRRAVDRFFNAICSAAPSWNPHFPFSHAFVLMPYLSFVPSATTRAASGRGPFGQPEVVVAVSKRTDDMARKPFTIRERMRSGFFPGNAAAWHKQQVAMQPVGGANSTVDFNIDPRPGLGAVPLNDGLNAYATAQVYYHRPGDWKEHPNLFNPLWGAKLMPMGDHSEFINTGGLGVMH